MKIEIDIDLLELLVDGFIDECLYGVDSSTENVIYELKDKIRKIKYGE